jgi:adenylate kinase
VHRIVFLGPPGAGKGTQATVLARELHLAHLSTGDLLRAAIAAKTPLGTEAESHVTAGRLVPDELVLQILAENLHAAEGRGGFVLDGFPRNLAQAKALDRITPIDVVISFDLPSDVLVRRLSARRVCPTCHSVYNLEGKPPQVAGKCDRDGTDLVQRPDDRPEAITTRLKVYEEQTAPLLAHYRDLSLLHPIDATGTPDEVGRRVRALAGHAGSSASSTKR